VSEIANTLLATGLVAEAGDGPSRGGRRPILLEFQDDAHTVLGVDVGATHVSVILTDLRGQVLTWEHLDHPVRTDPEGTEALIRSLCDRCLSRSEGARKRLLGLGVAVPSPVDPRNPDRLSDVVLPDWRGHRVLERLESFYGVPVLVDNDANLGALAEHWWGAGRGVEDFAYIKVGTGVGSGHMIRGEIYRGATGVAGEIGHLAIDPSGQPCVCGNRGCLATLVGSKALEERARTLLPDYPDSPLNGTSVTIMAIEDAALEDDPLAMTIVGEAAHNLGTAVAGVLNLMNPATVILGGSLSRLGERLLVPLRESVLRRTLVSSVAASEIRTSELGAQAIAVGAATLVLDDALEDPRAFPGMRTV
jgi:glucokinase-like ROK family protein